MHIFQTIFANACTDAIVLANKNIQLQSATHHKLKFRKNPSAPPTYHDFEFQKTMRSSWYLARQSLLQTLSLLALFAVMTTFFPQPNMELLQRNVIEWCEYKVRSDEFNIHKDRQIEFYARDEANEF